MPPKEQLPREFLNLVTYPKSRDPRNNRQMDQVASEVVGKKVGNVPAGLCGLFRQVKYSGKVRKISWYVLLDTSDENIGFSNSPSLLVFAW